MNQQKREIGHRNAFMTKSSRKNVPDMGVHLSVMCIQLASPSTKLPCVITIFKFLYFGTNKFVVIAFKFK